MIQSPFGSHRLPGAESRGPYSAPVSHHPEGVGKQGAEWGGVDSRQNLSTGAESAGAESVRVESPCFFELLWPAVDLSPNSRVHWWRHTKKKKAYRRACCSFVLEQVRLLDPTVPTGLLHLELEFRPPDRRHRDLDNLLARIKAGLDGLCDALGIDDRHFHAITVRVTGGPCEGGRVVVRIRSLG